MTKEEAKQWIEDLISTMKEETSGLFPDVPYKDEVYEALDEAVKALEQEPKQVELEGDGYADGELVYDYGKCPKCGWDFEEGDKDWEEPYCCHCGQKLKWFDNKAESENK